jgi:hypothetical protein
VVEIPTPPVVPVVGEHPAIVEPPLRELPEFRGVEVSDAEPVEADWTDEPEWRELSARIREVALSDDRVRQAFADRRHVVIGVTARSVKRARAASYQLVAFGYEDGLAYEVTVIDGEDGLAVRDVTSADYQPAPADEEIEAAVALARGNPRIADRIEPRYEAQALLVSAVDVGDEHHGRRRFSVVFGPADERLPRIHSIVDLTTEELVSVHIDNGGQR